MKFGDPVLRAKGAPIKEVTGEIKQLAADMIETMRAAHGVGLAAQQIGKPLQLTVIDVAGIEDRPSAMYIDGKEVPLEEHMPIVLLNPVLKLTKERRPHRRVPLLSRDHRGHRARERRPLPRARCSTARRSNSKPPACSRAPCSTRSITSTASSSSTA